MFKRVLKALFKSFSNSNKTPTEVVSAQAQHPVKAENQPQTVTLKNNTPISAHAADFLGYLFGESELHTDTDPFSDFVAARVERLLLSPKALLNELPVMPASVTTLLAELQSDDFDVDKLLKVIEHEPSMAADVIKLANSARYRRSEKEVTDLKTAFMNMGSQGLIEGVINTYLKNFAPRTNIYWRQFGEKIWQHSLDTAVYSKTLLKATDAQEDEATAYFVGLIRNLGNMIIFQVMVEAFAHVDPSVPPNSMAFKRLINAYAIKLTYTLAKFWEMPTAVLNAIGFQASSKFEATALSSAVREANYLNELKCLLTSELIDAAEYELRCRAFLRSAQAQQIALEVMQVFTSQDQSGN
ncbi:HDOD domain-containing protein [Vibrio sp. SCSIO 43136]|uniref:HDOD domain-containing protein n=1 Tax=Vibrio sp. SCSIO 43136 TaxID=2819101 RepID=UPI002074F2B5|nr:HDOD domain-containing protein [Vibrio sp. SCSIO 43136]USD67735.1 HDOD domain-containing protein [Vibrio sp. SCSIO 43136]